jgi:hypothetical protein
MTRGDSSSSSPLRFPAWQSEYEAVLLETNDAALFRRVEIAEEAIFSRRSDVENSSDHHAERQAIDEALARLGEIKRYRLPFE